MGEQKSFQVGAGLADETVMLAMKNLSAAGLSHEQIASGSLFAVVRTHVRMFSGPKTERAVLSMLLPALSATVRAILASESDEPV